VNVIGHDFHGQDFAAQFSCFALEQFAEILFDRPGKNLPSPCRAPNKMVVKKKNRRVG